MEVSTLEVLDPADTATLEATEVQATPPPPADITPQYSDLEALRSALQAASRADATAYQKAYIAGKYVAEAKEWVSSKGLVWKVWFPQYIKKIKYRTADHYQRVYLQAVATGKKYGSQAEALRAAKSAALAEGKKPRTRTTFEVKPAPTPTAPEPTTEVPTLSPSPVVASAAISPVGVVSIPFPGASKVVKAKAVAPVEVPEVEDTDSDRHPLTAAIRAVAADYSLVGDPLEVLDALLVRRGIPYSDVIGGLLTILATPPAK